MKSTLIDINKASKILRLSPQQVRALCRSGKIKSDKIGGSWVINDYEIHSYYDNNCCGVAEDQSVYSPRSETKSHKKPTALSFFSGAMGLDIGLEQSGFEILSCCELDNSSRKTILKNKPLISLIGDIRDYDAGQIRKSAGLKTDDDIDLVVGGPPCQAFSTAGRRQGFDDKRGNVLLTYLDRIIELRPKFAVIENVRGILSAPLKHRPHNLRGLGFSPLAHEEEKGGALYYVLERLRSAGYGVSFNLYNSANFGTPQKRERVIIICSREGNKLPHLIPTHAENGAFGLPQWRTFKEAVKGLPKKGLHHITFPEKRLKYYRMLKPGQYWRHLPKELQKEALGASYYAGGGKTGFLRRLAWDEPAPTLVTHPAMPATDLSHPIEDRPLSIEEYKRIQEFPDDWQIEGSLIEQYRQLGNAVPVSLGRAVGRLLINYMAGKKIKTIRKFPYSRYVNTDEDNWEREFEKRTRPLLALTG
ncbi:MAG: DNA cytosine methyltransferase [Nitrospirae bacterium]|nr:DNA cytosine methyltransferase [Nitrospirota bacterium]